MNDNKIANFIERFGGIIIGVLIGLIILNFPTLYEFFKFVIVVVICGWIGNYVQKNKTKVKEHLKNLIDRMQLEEKMRKVYIDLAITVVCIFLIVKFTALFLILVGIFAAVWFFVLDDKQKKQLRDKIAEFYRQKRGENNMSRKTARELAFKMIFASNFQTEELSYEEMMDALMKETEKKFIMIVAKILIF